MGSAPEEAMDEKKTEIGSVILWKKKKNVDMGEFTWVLISSAHLCEIQ